MKPGSIKILLVAPNERDTHYLRAQLENRGCSCFFALSTGEITLLLDRHSFDLVLSTSWMQDLMLAKLAHAKCSVFFSYPVRNGCWWLPLLHRGEHCSGSPALRAGEFNTVLEQVVLRAGRLQTEAA